MPLSYFHRLSARDRAIYRQSDRISGVELPDAAPLQRIAGELERALEGGRRRRVQAASRALVDELLRQLATAPVAVIVLPVRPSNDDSELHGRYDATEDGTAIIRVWMRTAAHRRVVRFRTFLRTLLHEVCHHLDFAHFGLADSFHTEGFFRRESSLTRQIAGTNARPGARSRRGATTQPRCDSEACEPHPPRKAQLDLPF